MKLIEKLKFWIAYKLDKNPQYCWTELALWAMFSNRKLKDCKVSNQCSDSNGDCYCGKLNQSSHNEELLI